jgi:hypothetical protein
VFPCVNSPFTKGYRKFPYANILNHKHLRKTAQGKLASNEMTT